MSFFRVTLCIIFCAFFLTACTAGRGEGTSRTPSGEAYVASLSDSERASLAKNRIKKIREIRKGDYFALKNNPDEALAYYLQVYEKLDEDVFIAKKIAHMYFQKKDWTNAYAYYVRVPVGELKSSEKNEMLSALFFDESQMDRMGELARIPISSEEKDFFTLINTCYTGIHNCVVDIQGYSGASLQANVLKATVRDAQKVSPDFQYRNFALAAKLYEYGAYRAAERLAREILESRPDYDQVTKLRAFSQYELGRIQEAKSLLLPFAEKHPDDLEVVVKLGEIYFSLGDYATSNLYFNNAILSGFTPKTDLERRLAYNYSLLGDTVSMVKVLGYLLQEEDMTEDDAAVAISLALQNGENIRAYTWADASFRKHADSSILAGLLMNSLRLVGKTSDAEALAMRMPEKLRESPIVLLELGILAYDRGDYDKASAYFDDVLLKDETADFSEEAKEYQNLIHIQKTSTGTADTGGSWWF